MEIIGGIIFLFVSVCCWIILPMMIEAHKMSSSSDSKNKVSYILGADIIDDLYNEKIDKQSLPQEDLFYLVGNRFTHRAKKYNKEYDSLMNIKNAVNRENDLLIVRSIMESLVILTNDPCLIKEAREQRCKVKHLGKENKDNATQTAV